jgi:uncharacterized protein YjbI with pentapeptide repeats
MSEVICSCQIHKEYPWFPCSKLLIESDPDGYCQLHSRRQNKDQAAFREALRVLWDQENKNYYDFRAVFFIGLFDPEDLFDSKEFNKRTHFSGAIFTEWADFFYASFKRDVYFSGATFAKGADFTGATFTHADFLRATFREGADFTGATFSAGADFCGATIEGRVVFRDINSRKKGEKPALPFIGYFRNIEFQDRGVLRFQDTSLAQVSFEDTDLRRPEFHHVTWNSYQGRQAIYDEVLLRENEKQNPWFWDWFWAWLSCHQALRAFALEIGHTADTTSRTGIGTYLAEEPAPPAPPWGDRYGEVERLYRNLQENYKQAGDYKNLGDFHYGEMEMHRRASKWGWFPFSWYYLYRFLSGYGERPSRALGLLIFFLVAMTALLGWAGLEILAPKHSNGYGDPFFYLLQKVTLQRPTWAEPVGFGGKLVAGLSVLLIPGQAALFLLALRNRLGRRR